MSITAAKVRRNSAIFGQSARMLHIHTPADDIDKIVSAEPMLGITPGETFTLDQNAMGGCVSAYVSLTTVTGTFNITVKVTGYDNTDTLVSTTVVLTQANAAAQTSIAFSHITEVMYLTLNSGTIPDTVEMNVGPKTSDATDLAVIGLPFQRVPVGAIRSISLTAAAAMPAYTYNADPGTLTLGAALTSGSTLVIVFNDELASYL
jgi:hypothetical protein